MILPRHPDLLSDQELTEWVHRLVTLKTPESIFLDYKATVATSSPSDKREIAKDISSFANERGGVVLYGVPETEQDGVPVPVDVDRVGMDPVSGLPEDIENILVGSLVPRLPELRIRKILLRTPPGKVVYLVWHPESWEAPHMIHAYKEKRYYKRGNFRAVPMEEGEVERLYLRRQARRTLADQFLKEADFGESLFPTDRPVSRLVVCPAFPFEDRVDFSRGVMQDWLGKNAPRNGQRWLPFIQGVNLMDTVESHYESSLEYRLFRNGAASVCSDLPAIPVRTISGRKFRNLLEDFLNNRVGRFYKQINMAGDAFIDVMFSNMEEAKFMPGIGNSQYNVADRLWHSPKLHFRVPTSAMNLSNENECAALMRRVMNQLTQCFGVWEFRG